MVDFLIKRPIAVTMTFIAILVLGIVAATRIPVSLMPDIDIPEITVQVSAQNTSARELENTVVRSLRQQLMQVAHMEDINSETHDGSGLIHMKFEYGTDVDFAFVEVNEKIDRAMNYLPRSVERPRVIKASATDIPVFYLNMTLKGAGRAEQSARNKNTGSTENGAGDLFPVSQKFVELSSFAGNVIRKRIEQLPEVALVDISGQVFPELLILPDMQKLDALGLSLGHLEQAIKGANINLGNLLIRDGQYQYNIRFASTLNDLRDLENLYLKVDERLVQLKDIAQVVRHPQKRKGLVTSNGKDALTLAVIKQSDARMKDLKSKLNDLMGHFREDYPHIDFNITRDQTRLLDYSISNLGQTLIYGALLAFMIMFFFLRDFKSPLLIGITIPTSLVISLLFFHLIGISINIISLSGLVLGIGMMIDNSIIVIDNITQHWDRRRGRESDEELLDGSCVSGTNEVFRPMLSSVLTTCAVFIPLIFISGISGALFYDQAMAITIGLLVSLIVSITLLPVYYRLFYKRNEKPRSSKWLQKINSIDYEAAYEKGFRFTMRNQRTMWGVFILMLVAAGVLYQMLDKSRLPAITQDEVLVGIDWNEKIHVDENQKRCGEILGEVNGSLVQSTCMVGEQQFILSHSDEAMASEAYIYLKAKSPAALDSVIQVLDGELKSRYKEANFKFSEAGNIFSLLFSDDEPPLVARLRATDDFGAAYNHHLDKTLKDIRQTLPEYYIQPIKWQENMVLNTNREKLLTYNVSFSEVYRALKSAFNSNEVMLITQNNTFLPVILGNKPLLISEIINELMVHNNKGEEIPLRNLVSETADRDLKSFVAGQEGVYYPVIFQINENQVESLRTKIRSTLGKDRFFEAGFSGSIFSNREMVKELSLIMLISLLLLYFILASQFESLALPVIVLLEVPIDIFGAFLMLKLFGGGINLMSLIGIIVMSGIIINDSILKIDTANQLYRNGNSLLRSLATAGQRRLKPILMTSITTVLALMPFLFTSGLGADLQKPLALAVIGGMTLGTVVSLYFVPLCYYYLVRGKEHRSAKRLMVEKTASV
ncbi:efflux RND transporter permease subunit [Puteibacter caeruleilacunae]|nr:efflux RND transporter permease subunit [Puteibacter caeruleilacunae]